MGRHWYTARRYAAAVERIAARLPVLRARRATSSPAFPARRTTITRRRWRSSESLPFTSLHVFPYSPRPGTAAERLPQLVSAARGSRARAAELRDLAAREGRRRTSASRVGGAADVVVIRDGETPPRADRGLPRRRARGRARRPASRALRRHARARATASAGRRGTRPARRVRFHGMSTRVRVPPSTSRPTAAR